MHKRYVRLFLVLLCLLGTCCLTSNIDKTNSSKYGAIYPIDIAYKATWDVMGPLNISSIGAATVVRWEVGQKLIAISAWHVFSNKFMSPDTLRYCQMPNRSPCVLKKVEILRKNEEADLVLLIGTTPEKFSGPAALVARDEPTLGEVVYVIGTPLQHSRSISRGVLSWKGWDGKTLGYFTDATIWYGNSGGGMFNSRGELIGVIKEIYRAPIEIGGFVVPGHPIGAFNLATSLPYIHKILQ